MCALPGYEAQRVEEMQWAFALEQQSDYDTEVADENINKSVPTREISVADITKELRSDRDTYGKGHEFATSVREVARDLRFSRNFDGSSLILGWLCAFALGKVVTTQPDPTKGVYKHVFTFFDPDVTGTAQLPVTSVAEKVTSGVTGIKRKLLALAINSLTISAEGFEHLNAAVDFIGSGKTAEFGLSLPGLTSVSYLTSNNAVVKLGDASEAITTRVRSWSIVINNNPREARGYFPSSDIYRGRLEIGAREIIPSLVVDLDATDDLLADFLGNQKVKLEITCEGDTILDPYKHHFKATFPSLYYRAIPLEERDGMFTYNISFDADTVIYTAADSPAPLVQLETQDDIPSLMGEALS